MHLKLVPEQISYYWDLIKTAVEESSPEISAEGANVILENLLCDAMQCWLLLLKDGEEFKLQAIIVTTLFRDNFYQTMYLRLCCLYGFTSLSPELWQEGFEAMRDYAKSTGCAYMEAFTDRKGLPEMIKRQFGGRTNYHIMVEV